MKRVFTSAKIAGLEVSFESSAVIAHLLLGVLLSFFAGQFLHLPFWIAIAGGLIASLIHGLSEFWHQLGHASAARQTGWPMRGIRFWLIFGESIYPEDEPELQARTHIHRALGGLPFSLLLAAAGFLAVPFLKPLGKLPYLLAWYTALDNLIFFSLGALLPLGFTDGSTLLHYWRQR